MTVRNLLRLTTCPYQIRTGRSSLFIKVKPKDVPRHLHEEVVKIVARGRRLVIYSEIPYYEIDVDVEVEVDPDLDIVDLPWE